MKSLEWPLRAAIVQGSRTPDSQSGNRGSNPRSGTSSAFSGIEGWATLSRNRLCQILALELVRGLPATSYLLVIESNLTSKEEHEDERSGKSAGVVAGAVFGRYGGGRCQLREPISIGYSRAAGGQFTGKVRSRAVCVDRRKVVIYRKQAGRDASVGRVKTSPRGRWKLRTGKPRAGNYYSRALPGKAARGVRCGGARSAVTHVS